MSAGGAARAQIPLLELLYFLKPEYGAEILTVVGQAWFFYGRWTVFGICIVGAFLRGSESDEDDGRGVVNYSVVY